MTIWLILGATLPGQSTQQVCVPDNVASQGPVSTIPMGARGPTGIFQNMRTQIRVPASALPATGSTISEVAVAGASAGDYLYSLLEVRLAHLPAGVAFSGSLQQNLAGATVVLSASTTRLSMAVDQWIPLGLSGTFVHDGVRDLIVDITIQGAFFTGTTPGTRRSSTLETVYALDYDAANPAAVGWGPFASGAKLCLTAAATPAVTVVGSGCPGTNGSPVTILGTGSPRRGQSFRVNAQNAPPQTVAALLIGTNGQTFGLLQLPFDMVQLGAPGCLLRTDIGLLTLAATDGAGQTGIDVPIPRRASLRGQPVLFQWGVADPSANALGVILSARLDATIQ